eukprot:3230540-Prymnesium_polylepis.2
MASQRTSGWWRCNWHGGGHPLLSSQQGEHKVGTRPRKCLKRCVPFARGVGCLEAAGTCKSGASRTTQPHCSSDCVS